MKRMNDCTTITILLDKPGILQNWLAQIASDAADTASGHGCQKIGVRKTG